MASLRKYRKKAGKLVIAVQLDLDTEGFRYQKWGAEQQCKAGDWLLNNDGDVYTVDGEVFASTYEEQSPGLYAKTTIVWAKEASEPGVVKTLEGETHYAAGDFIVSNSSDGADTWAVTADKFGEMYEPAS